MDFPFWGTVKMPQKLPRTVKDVIQFILEAYQEIDVDTNLCSRMCMSVGSRLQ